MSYRTRILGSFASTLTFALLVVLAVPAQAQVRAALVRDVDSAVRGVRHSEVVQMQFSAGQFSVFETITPTIPAGKKWFIQSVSMHTLLTDGQSLMEARVTIGSAARYWVHQAFQAASTTGSNPQRHFTGNQEINAMLNPGESIAVFLFRNDDLGSLALNFSNVRIHGFLVDANP